MEKKKDSIYSAETEWQFFCMIEILYDRGFPSVSLVEKLRIKVE